MTFGKWVANYHANRMNERMGQAFCNDFLGNIIDSQLYYEENNWKAYQLIQNWLIDNCYYPNVPMLIKCG